MEEKYRKYKYKYENAKRQYGGMDPATLVQLQNNAATAGTQQPLTPQENLIMQRANINIKKQRDNLQGNQAAMSHVLSHEENKGHNERLVQCLKGHSPEECKKQGCTWDQDNNCVPTQSSSWNPFGTPNIPPELLADYKRLQSENFGLKRTIDELQSTINRLKSPK
jgi:hypothetical protein